MVRTPATLDVLAQSRAIVVTLGMRATAPCVFSRLPPPRNTAVTRATVTTLARFVNDHLVASRYTSKINSCGISHTTSSWCMLKQHTRR